MSGEEDLQSPNEPVLQGDTTPVTITPVTTVLTITTVPVAMVGKVGMSMNYPTRRRPPKGEKKEWEERLACIESTQDWLIQVMDEALMGIPDTIAQVVQAELQLQQQMPQLRPPHHHLKSNSAHTTMSGIARITSSRSRWNFS
ncbi:UNVERIFIED_CONTAM: hypothetical protein K2H54_063366 [Gekko kuhli]